LPIAGHSVIGKRSETGDANRCDMKTPPLPISAALDAKACAHAGRIRKGASPFVLILALAGCGGAGNSPPPGDSDIAVTSAPAAQTVITGQTATFSVSATSPSSLSYQWQQNGVDIPGATSSSYVTPALDTGADNARFAVRITSASSSVTTAPAMLHVFTDASIPAPTEYQVDPAATDSAIDASRGSHEAFINSAVTPKRKLFVFMPGTGGTPPLYRLIVQAAANNGYHAIGLAFENVVSVGDLCSGSADPDCAGKVREERFSGRTRRH